jgi:hypothetical protein
MVTFQRYRLVPGDSEPVVLKVATTAADRAVQAQDSYVRRGLTQLWTPSPNLILP